MSNFSDSLQEQQAVAIDICEEGASFDWELLTSLDSDSNGRWHVRQMATQIWLAMSKEERMPRTQRELAKLLNVNEMTISRWKKLPGFQEEVTAIARSFLVVDLPEIYAALRKEAKAGSLPHIKVVLDLTGEFQVSALNHSESSRRNDGLSEDILRQIEKVYGSDNM